VKERVKGSAETLKVVFERDSTFRKRGILHLEAVDISRRDTACPL